MGEGIHRHTYTSFSIMILTQFNFSKLFLEEKDIGKSDRVEFEDCY